MKFILYFLFLNTSIIFCGEIKNQIYYEFPAHSVSHCVRRLNRSSTIGCSSKSDGNVGTIEVAFNQSNLIDKLFKINDDTIFVLSSRLFQQQNSTDKLLTNKHVQGLIILEDNFCNESFCQKNDFEGFSEDYKRPNIEFSLFLNHTFNPAGSKFGFKNWPFPIAYIDKRYKSEQDKIISCYDKFNKNPTSTKRCALEIKNFMSAVNSAETCMKYQDIQNRFAGLVNPVHFCTDFTGMNYYVHTKEIVKSRENNSVIVLISRLDSLSMFERSASGVNGAIVSASLLLSIMKLLMLQPEFKTGQNLNKDVLFLFLDNESYDYLGSSRFFLDLQHKNIANSSLSPINASHLDLLLELGELAFSDFKEFNFFYPHSFLKGNDKNKTLSYLNSLQNHFRHFGFMNSSVNDNLDLPPSSVQFMLRQRMMPAIVMADHQNTFQNQFYNSFLDTTPMKNNSQQLIAIANAVASFVFKEATGNDLTMNISLSDPYSPDKIINCFANNLLCDLLKEVLPIDTLKKLSSLGTPIPTQAHSSTKDIPLDYRLSYLLRNLVVYLSGKKTNNSVCESCTSCENLTWINSENGTKQCFITRIDAYDEFSFDNNLMPFWLTSSIVDKQSIRMFIRGPNSSLLIIGSILTSLAVLIMALISPKISVIFSADSH